MYCVLSFSNKIYEYQPPRAVVLKLIGSMDHPFEKIGWAWTTLLRLRWEILSGMCAKLRTVAATNNRVHALQSLYYFLFAPRIYIVVLRAHPLRGESNIQRDATGEVAITSPPFYNEPHRSHVLCVKAEPVTTFTSWSQHHFVAIGKPERHVLHTVAAISNRVHNRPQSLYYFLFAPHICCCSSRTSRSW